MDLDRLIAESLSLPNKRKRSSNRALLETCDICGDKASKQNHYGSKAHVCFSCRAFFRRCVKKKKIPVPLQCNSYLVKAGTCPIKTETRSICSYCRYQKCCSIGMNTNFVMTNDDIEEMKEKVHDSKLTGIEAKYLAPTSYEKRCRDSIQVDLSDWEPEEEFLQWLLNDQ